MSITVVELDGLEATLRAVVKEEVAAALAEDAKPAVGYLDVRGAAAYLSSTPAAVRAALKRGQLDAHRSETGRVLFDRSQLDAFARSGNA
jgi:hypothetical protein